jgi:hypothetical protein
MSVLSPTLKVPPELVVVDDVVVVVLADSFFDPQPAAMIASTAARNMRGISRFTGPPRF